MICRSRKLIWWEVMAWWATPARRLPTPNPLTASNDAQRARVNELSVLAGLQPLPAPPTVTIPSELVWRVMANRCVNLGSNQYNNFRVGVAISLPLHNRAAEGLLGHSLVEGKRIQTQREQLEQLIQVEVRNALQSLSTSEARLRSAAIARFNCRAAVRKRKAKARRRPIDNHFWCSNDRLPWPSPAATSSRRRQI